MPETRSITTPRTVDVRTALREGIARLRAANVPSDALAAELLLMHALGRDRTWLYSYPETPLEAAVAEKYFALISRRAAGEPTQYLTGKQEFWGLEFEVNRAVLIPRPETEHVIEVALERLGARGAALVRRCAWPTSALGLGALPWRLHGSCRALKFLARILRQRRWKLRGAMRHGMA